MKWLLIKEQISDIKNLENTRFFITNNYRNLPIGNKK